MDERPRKRILITGCSSGIGRSLATALAERGHEVIASARRLETIADLPVAAHLRIDVTDPASIADAISRCGPIDVLVNNAGYSMWGVIEAADDRDIFDVFNTNLFGAVRMIRAVLPQMRERRQGSIFQMSSAAARRSTALIGHYAATKAALDAYSEALRMELAPFGIHVCSIIMSAVESNVGTNRKMLEMEEYAAVEQASLARSAAIFSRATPTDEASARIVSAIESARPPVRLDGSGGALDLVDARARQTDEEWESSMLRELYGPDFATIPPAS